MKSTPQMIAECNSLSLCTISLHFRQSGFVWWFSCHFSVLKFYSRIFWWNVKSAPALELNITTVRWLTLTTLAVLGGLCWRLDGIYKILKVVLASLNALRPCIQCNGYNFALSKLYFMFWMLRNFAEAKVFEFKLKLTFTFTLF